MIQITSSDSFDIVSRALEDMKAEQGEKFSLESVNLAELKRRTGLSRGKLRKMKRDGFKRKQHGLIGTTAESTVLSGYTGFILVLHVTDTVCRRNVSDQFFTIYIYQSGELAYPF